MLFSFSATSSSSSSSSSFSSLSSFSESPPLPTAPFLPPFWGPWQPLPWWEEITQHQAHVRRLQILGAAQQVQLSTAEHPPVAHTARLPLWNAPSKPPTRLPPRARHLVQQTPKQKWAAGHPTGTSRHAVNVPPSTSAPLQAPKLHLLGGCDVPSQPALAVPRGCSGRATSYLNASMGRLLQG